MAKSRNNSISEGEFFGQISKRSNSLPEDIIKEVYYGMVKAIVGELREGRDIILPGLGKFYTVKKKPHRYLNQQLKQIILTAEKNQLEFTGAQALKEYLSSIQIKESD